MYVMYESHRSKAHRAADEIAKVAISRDVHATVHSIDEADPDDLTMARVLVVGCSTKVDTPFGGKTTRAARTWIEQLPDLHGKPVAVYCTYSFFPHTFADVTTRTAEVLAGLEQELELRGGKIVASQGILNRRMSEGANALVSAVLDYLGD